MTDHEPGWRRNLSRLARPLVLLGLSLVLGLGGVAWCVWSWWQAEQDGRRAQLAVQGQQERLRQAQASGQQARQDLAVWQAWGADGLVGALSVNDSRESLEDWKQTQAQGILNLNYRITPSVPAEPSLVPALPKATPYQFRSQGLRLVFEARHELLALSVLQDWQSRGPALPRIRRCVLTRLHPELDPEAAVAQGGANLKVECEAEWLFLQSTAQGAS